MNNILDVSIRDSYVCCNKTPEINTIKYIIKKVIKIGVTNIETGYFDFKQYNNNRNFLLGGSKEYFDFLERTSKKNPSLNIFKMLHPDKCNNLNELEVLSNRRFIHTIRIVYKERCTNLMEKQIKHLKDKGKRICLNITRVTEKSHQEIENICQFAIANNADTIYIADSNSNIYGSRLEQVLDLLKNQVNDYPEIKLGFHGHDGMNMALTNSLIAYEKGVQLIDGSMLPYGKFKKKNLNLFNLLIILMKEEKTQKSKKLFNAIECLDNLFEFNNLKYYSSFIESVLNKNIDEISLYKFLPDRLIYNQLVDEFLNPKCLEKCLNSKKCINNCKAK